MPDPNQPRSSILMLVDGLRPDMLGPWGNTWLETPQTNRLAAQSLLFEYCIAETTDFTSGIARFLTPRLAGAPGSDSSSLTETAGQVGAESVLVSGNPDRIPDAFDSFDRVVNVPLPAVAPNSEPAAEIESTRMATFMATSIDELLRIDEPSLVVLDCPGLSDAWDAPGTFRESLREDEDPEPTSIVQPPELEFNLASDDPDKLLDFQFAYGGQVLLFDQLLGILLDQIQQNEWANDALFCLTAMRGYPLGEHGVVGYYRPILHNELLQVPLLIRWPGDQQLAGRSQQLVQPGSAGGLLRDWQGRAGGWESDSQQAVATEAPPVSNTRVTGNSNRVPVIVKNEAMFDRPSSGVVSCCNIDSEACCSLQTPSWKYISGPSKHLYVKPDDRYEYNDVFDLCRGVAEELEEQLAGFRIVGSREP